MSYVGERFREKCTLIKMKSGSNKFGHIKKEMQMHWFIFSNSFNKHFRLERTLIVW